MFENPRKGRQARNFTTNAPKILDLKSSSEQIFSRKLPLGAPEISKTRELKTTCMHNSRKYIQYIQRNLTFCINMNLMNRPNRHWTVPPGKTAKFRVMPVIQWRSVAWFLISNNGAHVQICWSAVNKSSARDSARTIRAQRKFLAN